MAYAHVTDQPVVASESERDGVLDVGGVDVLVCVFGCADPFFTMEFCATERIDTRKQQKST